MKKLLLTSFSAIGAHAMDVATTIYMREKFPQTRELNPLFAQAVKEKKYGVLVLGKATGLSLSVVMVLIFSPKDRRRQELLKLAKLHNVTWLVVLNNLIQILIAERRS